MAGDILIDANVFMYAAGGEHPYRNSCRAIVRMLGREPAIDGGMTCVDTELFQEIAYRYASIGKPAVGREMQRAIRALGLRVLPVAESAIDRFIDLQETYREELEERRASVRDLLHVAVMHDAGIEAILTADRDFDLLDTKRLDPIALVRKARRNPRAI